MVFPVIKDKRWSDWFDINNNNIKESLPEQPGVYEIRTKFEINRLRGSSDLVYIGSAADSLKNRLTLKLFGNWTGLDRADKWLFSHANSLEVHYITTESEKDAKYLEGLLLWKYENEHWEIPPGNDKLEKKAILDHIEQKHKTSIDRLLKELLKQSKSNKEISEICEVPEYIVENLRVYFWL
jgi:excinuclease UvrABC nuclease subunit